MMNKTRMAWLLTLLMLVTACLPLMAGAEDETVSFTDSCGRTMDVPANITRIAPSGSLSQIVLLALCPEYFVGLASDWTPEKAAYLGDYTSLPVLGNLYGKGDINLEELAAQDPQIIIDIGEAKGSIAEDMDALQEQLGIPVVHIDAYMNNYGEAYRTLGALLGLEERAEEIALYCEEIYGRAVAMMESIPEESRVSAAYCLGDNGLSVIAKSSYHGEILDLLSNNVVELSDFSSKGSGDPVDMEQLLIWDPDFIVFAPESVYEDVGDDPLWQELSAIASGNYVETPSIPYNWLTSPASVQRYLGMMWLCDVFYPDVAEFDLQTEIARYFKIFYHSEPTQEQFDALMAAAKPVAK